MSYDAWKLDSGREDTDPLEDDAVLICRGCRGLIPSVAEAVEWNGWDWCPECVPLSVVEGRERESRADMAAGK